jgi:CheY-like chemotaxis protein
MLCAALAQDPALAHIPVAVLTAVPVVFPRLAGRPVAILTKPVDLYELSQVLSLHCKAVPRDAT